jgi:epoxyqueuosine reductase
MPSASDLTSAVKALALEEGFAAVAVAPVGRPPCGDRLEEWLRRGWHADMRYMERNLPLRLGEQSLMEGARSVICLATGYEPNDKGLASSRCLVAAYARGRDYHRVLKKKCIRLMDRIRSLSPAFEGRAMVDSAPVPERSLAAWSGLGWIGRNGCLYVPGLGSYVLLCEIVCNLPLVPGRPLEPACGNCGACVEACPTGAIGELGLVDARKCISYLTIECRGEVPRPYWPKMGASLFGCDRCQEACPQNRKNDDAEIRDTTLFPAENRVASPFSGNRGVSPFLPEDRATGEDHESGLSLEAVLRWSHDDWDAATRGSACRRATWEMFLRNAAIAAGNSGQASLIEPLEALRRRRPELGEIVEWAVARLGAPMRLPHGPPRT